MKTFKLKSLPKSTADIALLHWATETKIRQNSRIIQTTTDESKRDKAREENLMLSVLLNETEIVLKNKILGGYELEEIINKVLKKEKIYDTETKD